MKLLTLFLVLALALTAQCWTYEGHEMQGEASKLVYEGIKKTLYLSSYLVLKTSTNSPIRILPRS